MSVIVLTGGGTAGHSAPCIALIPDLKKIFDEAYYIGSKEGIEKNLVKKTGVTYFYVPTVKFERRLTLKNILIPAKLLSAVSAAKNLIKNLKPDVIFSKGGYVALPTVIAAKKLGVPVISHESDLSMGLANKIALKYSAKMLTAFEKTADGIQKAECVGIPLDKKLFCERDKAKILKKFGFERGKKVLLITGGSQGSRAINEAFGGARERLLKKYNVIHLCGKGKSSGVKAKGLYETEFAENMGEVFAACDLAVSRAGANTMFELAALCLPTLAIPLPKGNSRGDQVENAKYFKSKRLCEVLFEENLTPETLINSIERLQGEAAEISARLKKRDFTSANEKVLEILKVYAKEK